MTSRKCCPPHEWDEVHPGVWICLSCPAVKMHDEAVEGEKFDEEEL